jgi:hypothetical protein
LQEVRLGLRQPGAVNELPSGLWDYYADQIRGWRRDPAWDESLLPLLATLGIVGEPLSAAALARLTGGLDVVAVRRWCDFTFRPLLTAARAAEGGAPLRYEIYHASFREVLKALPSERPEEASGGLSYELEALADELQQATLSGHDRVADSYLAYFGGLDAGLPVLAREPAAAGIDDGYPLRHLARHLHHAGRVAELHRLLAVAHSGSRGGEVNVWFAAHDYADCLASYLEDLERAQNNSAAATDEALAKRQVAASLGTEVGYALMAASITSRAARISPQLLDLLVRSGRWSPGRGRDMPVG